MTLFNYAGEAQALIALLEKIPADDWDSRKSHVARLHAIHDEIKALHHLLTTTLDADGGRIIISDTAARELEVAAVFAREVK